MTIPFLIAFFSFAYFRLGGEIYITELILAVYLLLSIPKFRLLSEPLPRKILLFGFLWLLSQIATDFIRGTTSENYLRGWAAITFFLVDFCALYIMVRQRPQVLRALVLGYALGIIFGLLVAPSEYSHVEPWKFGYGLPVTMLALLFLSTGNRYKTKYGLMLLLMLGTLSIYLNARSLGGMTILTAVVLLFSTQFFTRFTELRRNPLRLAGMAAGVMLAVVGMLAVYQWIAVSAYLPERGAEKYQIYKTSDTGLPGLIAGGRPEIFISSQAVLDSPIIGHGSWAEDANYTYMYYAVIDKLGLDIDEATLRNRVESSDLIPTHSVLMQAWVWAGLMGAVFWLFVLSFITRSTFSSLGKSHSLQPLVVFSYIAAIWNLSFSPFGANQRIYWALAIVIIFIGGLLLESGAKAVKNSSRSAAK